MSLINIPNLLTFLRVIMVPLFTVVFYLPGFWSPVLCTIIFCIAAITDWLDGFLARRWKQTTKFGRFLDPIADKIMVITALILISEHFRVWWVTIPASSIIVREVIISALRAWIAGFKDQNELIVSKISKVKTCIQILALTALLYRSNEWIIITGVITLYIAVVLTLWSMCYYIFSVRFLFLNR